MVDAATLCFINTLIIRKVGIMDNINCGESTCMYESRDIRTGSIRPPRLDLDGGRVGWCLGVWEGGRYDNLYALLSRGGAFGKGEGRRSLTVPPCKQTDLPTDSR